jgi:hypothetical protein
MRNSAVSGQFYESDKKALEKQIKELFGAVKSKAKAKAIGLIVPHAGYIYSGKAAASAYSALKSQKFDTFVILGPNHSGFDSAVSLEDFETPLGIAKNDEEFSEVLAKAIGNDEQSHKHEHCIEVQLPFLQHLFKEISIVPVLIGRESYEKCREIARLIFETAEKQKKKICVIASSDLTHYGQGYGFVPFTGNTKEIKKKMYELDKKAISFIEKLQGKEFFDFSENLTICGRNAITILIEFCKITKAKARFVEYYTSGDVAKDYKNSVGYAAISFQG